jgi:hypothetical protein
MSATEEAPESLIDALIDARIKRDAAEAEVRRLRRVIADITKMIEEAVP